ncbi:hypothetical protein DFH28DRAFT_1059146 [Melampsora americana]|nr:hypothetical protein DFH28DRAFT_1059146 [Melampsora americana]
MTNDQTTKQLVQLQSIIDHPSKSIHSKEIIHNLILSLGSINSSIKFKANNALAILLLNQSNQSTTFISTSISDLLDSTHLLDCCIALRSLSSILQLSPTLGLELISKNQVINRLDDLIHLSSIPSSKSKPLPPIEFNLNFEICHFLGLATNHKLIRESITTEWPKALKYLTTLCLSKINHHESHPTRFAASLVLMKLQITRTEKVNESISSDEEIPKIGKLVRIFIDGFTLNHPASLSIIIEGLALVSEKAFVRQLLISSQECMLKTFHKLISDQSNQNELTQIKIDTSISYGISTILKNLLCFKEIKSEEDQVTERLRKLATEQNQSKSNKIEEIDEDELVTVEDEEVKQWISNLLFKDHQLMEIIGNLSKSESKEVRRLTGKVLLNLIEKQEFRGKVIQDGGARMLLKIIASLTISSTNLDSNSNLKSNSKSNSKPQLDSNDLPTLQALSKLLITANPLLIFGPLPTSPLLISTIKPLTTLLTHPSSTLLQTFEALMALTNVASLDEGLASYIANTPLVLEKVEECLMGIRTGENVLVRRAASELICNLASTELVLKSFISFEDEALKSNDQENVKRLNSKGKSRLHLLIALSFSEDIQTSLASSATLSILTEHSSMIRIGLMKDEKLMKSLERVVGEILRDVDQIPLQFRVLSLLNNLVMEDELVMENECKELKEVVQEMYQRLRMDGQSDDEMKGEMRKLIENILKINST